MYLLVPIDFSAFNAFLLNMDYIEWLLKKQIKNATA